ncbi:hypothetical protein ACNKHU_22215 [Shigella flexneri]
MFHYNEKDRNEANCQHCCGIRPSRRYLPRFARQNRHHDDNQRQHAEKKAREVIKDWVETTAPLR